MKMTWTNIPKNIEDYFGFVYCITNNINRRKYIGKKFFWKTYKKKPTKYLLKDGTYVKNKKGKRILNKRTTKQHFKIETKWKNYWGSNKTLTEDIEKYGKKNFGREILLPCKTKWDCAYYEAKMQFDLKVLFDKNFYNEYIGCRLRSRK